MRWISFVCLFVVLGESFGMRNFSCPRLKLKNGRVKLRQRGRYIEFLCNKGYLRAGERLAICVQGEWDSLPPKCVRPTCFPVKPPPNSLIYPSHSGGVLTFYCKHGYELRGHSIVYCDGKNWDNNSPTCLLSNTKPAMSCDFENEDLCHWTHDFNNDFTWTRYNYGTPSGAHLIGTGPSYDHTKGNNKDGYYMYIESSSRNINDTARLISPVYDKTTNNTCFEFYYHMFGACIGELRVFLKKVSQDWSLDPRTAFFVKRHNQGNHWFRSITELGPIPEDFQIVIEGVRGDSYDSDIAIDDVRLILDCNLGDTSTTTEYCETEQMFTVESCRNRCGVSNDMTTPTSGSNYLIVCDCGPECYFRSRCCPDYYDLCVVPNTDTTSATELSGYTTENFNSSSFSRTEMEFIEPTTPVEDKPSTEIQEITSDTTVETTMETTIPSPNNRRPTIHTPLTEVRPVTTKTATPSTTKPPTYVPLTKVMPTISRTPTKITFLSSTTSRKPTTYVPLTKGRPAISITPTKIAIQTMPKRPTKIAIQTMPKTPTKIAIQTMPKTPTKIAIQTMPKRPTKMNLPGTNIKSENVNIQTIATVHRRTLLPLVLTKELEKGAEKALDTLVNDIEKITFKPLLPTLQSAVPELSVVTGHNPNLSSEANNDDINEVDEVEIQWNNSDEGSFEESPPTDVINHYEERKNQIDKEIKNEINRDFFGRGKHEELVVKTEESSLQHTTVIVLCSLFSVIVTLVGLVVAYRKYRALPYSKRILRLGKSRRDSQSDVFYLTTDEQLSFALNYDSL